MVFSEKHEIWYNIANPRAVPQLKWSVLHWPPVPRSVVQSLARFSTLPIPLRMFMLMMREIGERALCGKRWSFASMFL